MVLGVKNQLANAGDIRNIDLIPGAGRKWQLTPVYLPGESHGHHRDVHDSVSTHAHDIY